MGWSNPITNIETVDNVVRLSMMFNGPLPPGIEPAADPQAVSNQLWDLRKTLVAKIESDLAELARLQLSFFAAKAAEFNEQG